MLPTLRGEPFFAGGETERNPPTRESRDGLAEREIVRGAGDVGRERLEREGVRLIGGAGLVGRDVAMRLEREFCRAGELGRDPEGETEE